MAATPENTRRSFLRGAALATAGFVVGGRTDSGIGAGLGMSTEGPALAEEHGPSLGRGMGEQTSAEREVRTGPVFGPREKRPGYHVPGNPQDMMGMLHKMEDRMRDYRNPNPVTGLDCPPQAASIPASLRPLTEDQRSCE
jgi:hypothetical protein